MEKSNVVEIAGRDTMPLLYLKGTYSGDMGAPLDVLVV